MLRWLSNVWFLLRLASLLDHLLMREHNENSLANSGGSRRRDLMREASCRRRRNTYRDVNFNGLSGWRLC